MIMITGASGELQIPVAYGDICAVMQDPAAYSSGARAELTRSFQVQN